MTDKVQYQRVFLITPEGDRHEFVGRAAFFEEKDMVIDRVEVIVPEDLPEGVTFETIEDMGKQMVEDLQERNDDE